MKQNRQVSGSLFLVCIVAFFIMGFGLGLSAHLTITRKFYSVPPIEVTSKDGPVTKWSIGIETDNKNE